MAWLLATIPEYAKEKDSAWLLALSRRSLASLSLCVPLPPSHAARVPHTPFVCFVCVAVCSMGSCRSIAAQRNSQRR